MRARSSRLRGAHAVASALLVASGLAWLSGCPEPLGCDELGCPYGQVCDEQTGACRAPVSDCTLDPTICGPDQTCNEALGRCFSRQQLCGRDQAQCPRGQECEAELGVCKPIGLCETDGDCAVVERCVAGGCEAIPCTSSLDCGQRGFICERGACVPGCALPEAPCPEGRFCRAGGAPTGECVEGCNQDQDCDFGYACDLSLEQPTCVEEPPCDVDEECRADEVCRQGSCQQSPCAEDADCPQGQTCALAQCVGGECTEDMFSPNHTVEQAASLPEQVEITNLNRCAGRPDWFELELVDGEVIEIEVRQGGEQDLEVYLFDDSLRLLAVDERAQSTSQVRYQARRDQTVYLRVDTAALRSTSYALSVSRAQLEACAEDDFEQNDGPASARPLELIQGTPLTLPLRLCGADEDWFEVEMEDERGGLRLRAQSPQPVQVTMYAPGGEVFEVDGQLELLRVGQAGDYLVRARSARRQDTSMSLTWTELSPYACPGAGLHDAPERAEVLEPELEAARALCPTDAQAWEVDWYALAPPEQLSILRVRARPLGQIPGLRLALIERTEPEEGSMEPGTQLIRVAEAEGADEVLELSALVSAERQLYVRVSSEQAPGRLREQPLYEIYYDYESF